MTLVEMAKLQDKELARLYAIEEEYDKLLKVCEELKKENGELKDKVKWYKVTDGGLPKATNQNWSKDVLFQTDEGDLIIGFYDHAVGAWYETATDEIVPGVVAWCDPHRKE